MKSLKELFEIEIRTTMIFICLSISTSICCIGCFFQYQQVQFDFELTENYISEAAKNVLAEQQPILFQQSLQEFWNAFDKKLAAITGIEVYFDESLVSQVGRPKARFSNLDFEKISCSKSAQQNICVHFFVDPMRFLKRIFYFLFAVFISALAAYFFRKKIAEKNIGRLVDPLESEIERIGILNRDFEKVHEVNLDLVGASTTIENQLFRIREVSLLSDAYNDLLILSQKNLALKKSIELAKSMSNLASQVAHDIRSPLSALNMISSTLTNVSEEKRILIRNSIQRINDIANDLLAKSKVSESSHTNDASTGITDGQSKNGNSKSEFVLLPTLIDAIVSEKRIHFRDRAGIQIEADINQSYGIFVKLNANEFSRVLSNLINNSVEAFSDAHGKVAVCLRKYGDKVSIVVQDNGKGIPPEVLAKLGERGISHGKDGTQSGSGLGVWHAKSTIESFGGQFQINSKVGEGTQMVMTLSIVESPAWFQPNLSLQPLQKIISLDDDMSIHGIWRGRLESINTGTKQPELLNFTSGIEFKKYIQDLNLSPSERVLFLIDFELLNQSQTGLDIIGELNLNSKKNYQVILVTSRYDEPHIRSRCAALGIKMIPKNMAGFVPIEIEPEKEKYDCVLIDDESLNHMTWSLFAKENNKSIKSFNKMADFMADASKIDLASPIYIDSNLGVEGKGEILAEAVSNLGFKTIYIATGYEPSSVAAPVYVTGVVGKYPAF